MDQISPAVIQALLARKQQLQPMPNYQPPPGWQGGDVPVPQEMPNYGGEVSDPRLQGMRAMDDPAVQAAIARLLGARQ